MKFITGEKTEDGSKGKERDRVRDDGRNRKYIKNYTERGRTRKEKRKRQKKREKQTHQNHQIHHLKMKIKRRKWGKIETHYMKKENIS